MLKKCKIIITPSFTPARLQIRDFVVRPNGKLMQVDREIVKEHNYHYADRPYHERLYQKVRLAVVTLDDTLVFWHDQLVKVPLVTGETAKTGQKSMSITGSVLRFDPYKTVLWIPGCPVVRRPTVEDFQECCENDGVIWVGSVNNRKYLQTRLHPWQNENIS